MASHATGDGGIPARDAAKRGLKRIMTLGGAYGTRNYTVRDLRDQKGKRVLVETLPFSPEEAAAAEEAGIDTMKVRFDPAQPEPAAAIRRAAFIEDESMLFVHAGIDPSRPLSAQRDALWWGGAPAS